jgi:protein-disulfide isomerase
MEAEAALCAGDLGWKDKYYEFIKKTFDGSKTNGRSYTKESMAKLWGTIGLDETKLLSCITTWKFKDKAQKEMSEWQTLFGITWTPGNVLINNKTGKWDKLPGAYPTASFKEKIDSLLK